MTTEAATVKQSHPESPWFPQLREGPFRPPAAYGQWREEDDWCRAAAEIDGFERYLGETVRHRP